MQIGKNIPRQKGILSNPKTQSAIKQTLGILSKPTFDQGAFDMSQDPNGWFINLTDSFGATNPYENARDELPFTISLDHNNYGDEDQAFFKVRNGRWSRVLGMNGVVDMYIDATTTLLDLGWSLKTNYMIERNTNGLNSDDDHYWVHSLAHLTPTNDNDNNIRWVYLILQDILDDNMVETPTSPTPNGLQPSKLTLKIGPVGATSKDDIEILEQHQNGHKQFMIKFLGSIINLGGKLLINQEWVGNIKDQYIVPDKLAQNRGIDWNNVTSQNYLIGLDYYNNTASFTHNALQDNNVRAKLFDESTIVGWSNDRAMVYYDVISYPDTDNPGDPKQIVKKYSRIDSNNVHGHLTDSGCSLEITDNDTPDIDGFSNGATSDYITQVYHFFEPVDKDEDTDDNPTEGDIIEVKDYKELDGDQFYLIARQNANSNTLTVPKVAYLDMSNVHGFTHSMFISNTPFTNNPVDDASNFVPLLWTSTLLEETAYNLSSNNLQIAKNGIYRIHVNIRLTPQTTTLHEGVLWLHIYNNNNQLLNKYPIDVVNLDYHKCDCCDCETDSTDISSSSSGDGDCCEKYYNSYLSITGEVIVRLDDDLVGKVAGLDLTNDGTVLTYLSLDITGGDISSAYIVDGGYMSVERIKDLGEQ